MLKISRLADYATVIMQWLAAHTDQPYSAAVIAEQTQITVPTVSKLLKILQEVNLLQSTRGPAGGYQLSRPATEIDLYEIIAAIDGNPAMTVCSVSEHDCEMHEGCHMRGNWQFINQMVADLLKGYSLADMGTRK